MSEQPISPEARALCYYFVHEECGDSPGCHTIQQALTAAAQAERRACLEIAREWGNEHCAKRIEERG